MGDVFPTPAVLHRSTPAPAPKPTLMPSTTAFTSSFTPTATPSPAPTPAHRPPPHTHTPSTCKAHAPPTSPNNLPLVYTRRTFVTALGALFGLSASAHLERARAAEPPNPAPLQSLQQMRARVDDIDPLITAAKWDAVRTVLATRPLTSAKDACNKLLERSSEDLTGAIVGLREDLVSAIRLLDTSVYANVFIGEDRQILGTKVDYDVPRTYLADLKEALDALIDIASG